MPVLSRRRGRNARNTGTDDCAHVDRWCLRWSQRTLWRGLVVATVMAGCAGAAPTGSPGERCAGGSAISGRPLRAATTVAPLTSIVAELVRGTDTQVDGIVAEGADSHTFMPRPSHAAVLAEADLVLVNGLGLEQPLIEFAAANVSSGTAMCELAGIALPRDEWRFDRSFPESGGLPNPHVWMSPRLAMAMAAAATDQLARLDPANATAYRSNLKALSARVELLDSAIRQATATLDDTQRQLVTYHDAYIYFAEDYGWNVVGAVQPSSFAEPTPSDVSEIVEQIRSLKVRAVFGSETFASGVLERIADETGARYVDSMRDDDLPGFVGDASHSWYELVRRNAITMVEAMGGDAAALHGLDLPGVDDGLDVTYAS